MLSDGSRGAERFRTAAQMSSRVVFDLAVRRGAMIQCGEARGKYFYDKWYASGMIHSIALAGKSSGIGYPVIE